MVNTFGEFLKKTRKQHGLTISDVGAKIECHPSLISAYEIGKRNPSLRILKKLAPLYDVPYLKLLKMKEKNEGDATFIAQKQLAAAKRQIKKYEETLKTIRKLATSSGTREEIKKIATLALFESEDKMIK